MKPRKGDLAAREPHGEVVPVPPLAPELRPAPPGRARRLPAGVYLARLAPGSRRTIRYALDTIAALLTDGCMDAETLPWAELRYPHTAAVRAVLAERVAPATANKQLAALRGVLREAWRLGLMAAEDYHRAVDLPCVPGSTLPAGRALGWAELRALFWACADGTPGGARDAALLALLYGALLRRAEAVALDLADHDPATGALKVHGKGRQQRLSYLPAGGRAALDAWRAVRGDDDGPLLCPVRRDGLVTVRRLSGQAVLDALHKRQRLARIEPCTPHDLRRTTIGDLLDAGVDLATVQRLAGHAQVQTTARYDRRPEEVKRQASERLLVPYVSEPGTRRPYRTRKSTSTRWPDPPSGL